MIHVRSLLFFFFRRVRCGVEIGYQVSSDSLTFWVGYGVRRFGPLRFFIFASLSVLTRLHRAARFVNHSLHHPSTPLTGEKDVASAHKRLYPLLLPRPIPRQHRLRYTRYGYRPRGRRSPGGAAIKSS